MSPSGIKIGRDEYCSSSTYADEHRRIYVAPVDWTPKFTPAKRPDTRKQRVISNELRRDFLKKKRRAK